MAVEVDGEGDPIVMVHGLGGTTNTWTPLLPAMTHAKRIRIELPGSGRSHRAHALQDNTPIEAHRRSTYSSTRCCVCAHSLECHAHILLATRWARSCVNTWRCAPQQRVRSLALFGALPAPPEAARQGLRTRATKARDEGMFGIADAIVQGALFELDARTVAGGRRLRA